MLDRRKLLYALVTILLVSGGINPGKALFAIETATGVSVKIDLERIQILDLQTAQDIAVQNNPTITAAEARVRQAKERVWQARSAYFPQLSASGSGTRSILSENAYSLELMNNPMADDTTDRYNARLMATWTLFNGFAREYSSLSARYGMESTKEARKDTLRVLLSSVASSYYNAQLALENIIIAEANAAFNHRLLDEAKARYEVGTGSLSDVLNFEVQINSAKANLIQAKRQYELAAYGLAALMGIPDAILPPHIKLSKLETERQAELAAPDEQTMIQYALEHRPDVQRAYHAVAQSKAGVGAARAGFFPSINLTGILDANQTDNKDFEQDDFSKSIAVNVSYTLFAGGYNRAKVSEARSGLAEAKSNLENTKINLKSEIASAVATLISAQEQLALQRSNAKLVQQVRDLVEKEYAAGQASLVRLNEAQRDLVAAQGNLALSLVSMRQAWENLRAGTGEILLPIE
jgi:outer membrane protein TolC